MSVHRLSDSTETTNKSLFKLYRRIDMPVSFYKLTHNAQTQNSNQLIHLQSNSASTMISTNYNMYQIIYLSILLICYNNRIVVESFSTSSAIAITTNSRQHYTSSSRCSRGGLLMSAGEATLPMPIEGEGTY